MDLAKRKNFWIMVEMLQYADFIDQSWETLFIGEDFLFGEYFDGEGLLGIFLDGLVDFGKASCTYLKLYFILFVKIRNYCHFPKESFPLFEVSERASHQNQDFLSFLELKAIRIWLDNPVTLH